MKGQSSDRRKILVLSENGRTWRARNPEEKFLIAHRLDGVAVKQQPCCDFAAEVHASPARTKVYLLEFKGSDLQQALRQLDATWNLFQKELQNSQVFARAVCSRIPQPKLRSQLETRLEKRCRASGGDFIKESKELTERV